MFGSSVRFFLQCGCGHRGQVQVRCEAEQMPEGQKVPRALTRGCVKSSRPV